MSFVQPSTVQVVAESLEIPKLSSDAAKALAPDVEYRLREITQEALKFMRHSKRSTLTADDINQALRLRNVEPIYGFGSKDPARFVRAAGHSDLFYVRDPELSFDQVIARPLPRPPVEVGLVPHWLVVEGVQPAIPENCAPPERTAKRQRFSRSTAAAARPAAATAVAGPSGAAAAGEADAATVRPPVKHVLSQELQLYFDKVSQLLRSGGRLPAASSSAAAAADARDAAQPTAQESEVQKAVLASLASDPGLHALAPYLVQLIGELVAKSLRSLPHLALLLAAAEALLVNEGLEMEGLLHQLLPALITCIVAKRLGGSPTADHWAVRGQAARLAALVVARYGAAYPSLQPRITKTLLKALLDPSKPLTTHYGAIVGLAALGPQVVRLLVLPNLEPYLALLHRELDAPADRQRNELKRYEAWRCYGALLTAVASALYDRITSRYRDHILAVPKDSDAVLAHQPPVEADAPAAQQTDGAAADAAAPMDVDSQQQLSSSPSEAALASATGKALDGATVNAALDSGQHQAIANGVSSSRGKTIQPHHQAMTAAQSSAAAGWKQSGTEAGPVVVMPARQGLPVAASPVLISIKSVLSEAWREDSDLGAQLEAVHELFGDAMLPWVPTTVMTSVFI